MLAQTYGIAIPPDVVAGTLSAQADATGTLDSALSSINAFADWQIADSTFPGRGELTLANNRATLDNTRLFVAEGTVDAEAVLQLADLGWQANIVTSSSAC